MQKSTKVGILGGGQLAYMLAEAAIAEGLHPVALVQSEDEPCAQYLRISKTGTVLKGPEKLVELIKLCEVIAFENEFIDLTQLERAAGRAGKSEEVFKPSLFAIGVLQDKFSQKEILTQLKIPTAPYIKVDEKDVSSLLGRFPNGCVLKWSRMGYDGKGVLFLPDLTQYDHKRLHLFFAEAHQRDAVIYAEEKVDFERELAMVCVRSVNGEFISYPMVVSEQENGVCKRVFGPATAMGAHNELEAKASYAAKKVAEKCGLVGSFALEFFETLAGELWVNEIAPRVHNSGHYSQDAADVSQFAAHWTALLGNPLRAPRCAPFFGMLNLLGKTTAPASVLGDFALQDLKEVAGEASGFRLGYHGYAKTELKPGRKMAHVNAVASSAVLGAALESQMREFFKGIDEKWSG